MPVENSLNVLPESRAFLHIIPRDWHIARNLSDENDYDFLLAAGDDKTDEDMFRALSDRACTIKIGSGHTLAQYHLKDQLEVLRLLRELINETELVPL